MKNLAHPNKFERHLTLLSTHYRKAERYADEAPDVSLSQARKAAEAICQHIFLQEIGNVGSLTLNDVLRELGHRRVVPKRILLPLRTIQAYGNYASHFQDESFDVDVDFANPCLSALRQVYRWYTRAYLNVDAPDDLMSLADAPRKPKVNPAERRSASEDAGWRRENSGAPLRHLPVDCLSATGSRLNLVCPTDFSAVEKANEMTRPFYGDEAIPVEVYRAWWSKNPQIFTALTDCESNVLGYFDVFPVSDFFLEEFTEGRIRETDLRPEHILSPAEAVVSSQLYLGGLAVDSPNTFWGSRNAVLLLWGLIHYLKSFYPGNRPRILYALGSTEEGDELLKRFNFSVLAKSDERPDAHNFYALPFTQSLLNNYLSVIQDWSSICDIQWNEGGLRP